MADYNSNTVEIGVGALFPIQLSKNDAGQQGWYPADGDPALIENNLRSLIEYTIGQRFRQEDFGTRLWECIEESNTQALTFMAREFLVEAIRKYESRIQLRRVTTTQYNQYLYIVMEYWLVGLGQGGSMILKYNRSTNTLTT